MGAAFIILTVRLQGRNKPAPFRDLGGADATAFAV